MLKPFGISIIAHLALISLVWVGFSIPLPRHDVEFYYSGSFVSVEDVPRQKVLIPVKAAEGASFAPWAKMRELNKPKR